MAHTINVLLLEDNPEDAELVVHHLRDSGFEARYQVVDSELAYTAALSLSLDLILADYDLMQFDGLRALLRRTNPVRCGGSLPAECR